MEDSCEPTKPKRLKAGTSWSKAGDITGNVKQVDLPHLVVDKILENLAFKDLLQCSLVNKVWNHEARRLLREKHQCALIVDLDKPMAEEIIKLNTTLAAAKWPLPYGSLSIRKRVKNLVEKHSERERELVDYHQLKNIILRAGPFEVVQLDISCCSVGAGACIIRNLLGEVQKTVKVLIVKNLDGWNMFQNASGLPELKKLEIHPTAIIFPLDQVRIRNFLKYSEKLETVGVISSKWLKLLDRIPRARKLAVIKEFTCDHMYRDLRRAAGFAELGPKLEKLCTPMQPYNFYPWYGPDETESISMSLLLSSRASLIELEVTYEMLQQILREKPFVLFENVRRLTVAVPWDICREGLQRNQVIIALFPKLEDLIVITEQARPVNYLFDVD